VFQFVIIFMHFMACSGETEAEILLMFKISLQNSKALSNWNEANPPCTGNHANWMGVVCSHDGAVLGLRLENMGLTGTIDVDSLAKLKNLRTLNLINNKFDGSLPDFTGLIVLRRIYLSNNRFSSEIVMDAFQGMLSLRKLDLSNNRFSGPIPASLAALPRLVELKLDGNQFDGEIPEFPPGKLAIFNVSNNDLVGHIPPTLSNFSASAFSGNRDLCGAPLQTCDDSSRISVGPLIIVSVLVAAAVAALVAVFFILHGHWQPVGGGGFPGVDPGSKPPELEKLESGHSVTATATAPDKINHSRKKPKPNVKITFLKEGRYEFDMADLLKASAEILGSGIFSSTYKATLNNGQAMVVKRFRQMNNLTKEEFYEHMWRLGKLNHPNLLPIVGFYYWKEEKLLVADYIEQSSLASHLHGTMTTPRKRSRDHIGWPMRLNIVKGVSRGLLYLYDELPSLTTPHGHLKSSNILLDGSYAPLLTDYGLVPVVYPEHAEEHMISYKSPEHLQSGRISKKTDVWSLGIMIVEILTGKFPSNFLQRGHGGSAADMQGWVDAVVRDGENAEVLDGDMERDEECEGEMMKLLRIGLSCSDVDVNMRPDIREAVHRIEQVME
ncbi:receptor-like protein kinase, partial [Genlisea aurea]